MPSRCPHCNALIASDKSCSCWGSLMELVGRTDYAEQETPHSPPFAQDPPAQDPPTHGPPPTLPEKAYATVITEKRPTSRKALWAPVFAVFYESFSFFRQDKITKKSSANIPLVVLPKRSAFLLLGLHFLSLFLLFFSIHRALLRSGRTDGLTPIFMVAFPLVLVFIHILVDCGVTMLFQNSPASPPPIGEILSIASANTSLFTLVALVASLLTFLSFSSSFVFFLELLLLLLSFVSTIFLFYLRLKPIFTESKRRMSVVILSFSIKTALIGVAFLSQILRIGKDILSSFLP